MRWGLVAIVSALVFAATALVAVYFASLEPASSAGGAPDRVPAAQSAAPLPPPIAPIPVPDLPRPAASISPEPPKPMEYAPTPPPPPPGSWEAVQPVARLSALGPLGAAVRSGLQGLEPRLADCFARPAPAREARIGAGAGDAPGSGPAVLMLELETGTEEIRIVDAPLDARGDTDRGVVACVQQVLRGQTFPAPGAQPGGRHRVPYPVMQ